MTIHLNKLLCNTHYSQEVEEELTKVEEELNGKVVDKKNSNSNENENENQNEIEHGHGHGHGNVPEDGHIQGVLSIGTQLKNHILIFLIFFQKKTKFAIKPRIEKLRWGQLDIC